MIEISSYYSINSMRQMLKEEANNPNPKGGFYNRPNQKKRRKINRRTGKRR